MTEESKYEEESMNEEAVDTDKVLNRLQDELTDVKELYESVNSAKESFRRFRWSIKGFIEQSGELAAKYGSVGTLNTELDAEDYAKLAELVLKDEHDIEVILNILYDHLVKHYVEHKDSLNNWLLTKTTWDIDPTEPNKDDDTLDH